MYHLWLNFMGLKLITKIKPGLDKVVVPLLFHCSKSIRKPRSYGPKANANGGFKKELVFKKRKLITKIKVGVHSEAIANLFKENEIL